MTAASATTRLGDRFNAFLRSALWQDRDETPLSVLSALARLDVDPWEEAAQLAALPEESASAKLAAMLANLPGGPADRRDLDAHCARSVRLLSFVAGAAQARAEPTGPPAGRHRGVLFLAVGSLMLALTVMAAQRPAGRAPPASATPELHAALTPGPAPRQ
jgi:hypothetical protein